MRTVRLLLWLRWKLFLRSGSGSNRWAGAAMVALLAIAFSPAWLGGAIAAHEAVRGNGASAILVAFGACQLAWLSLGLLSGALGRAFDLDKLLRHPVRPAAVFAINIGASLLGPTPLLALPTLVAVAIAAGERGGPAAAAGAALGGLGLLLVTAALLQVLLALLDEVLRLERMRFLANALLTLMLVGMQFGARMLTHRLSQDVLVRFANHEITGTSALALARAMFERLPTVAAPAAIATGALDAAPWRALAGLAATATLLAIAIAPGAALMRRTARGGTDAGSGAPARSERRRAGAGGFGIGARVLPPGAALLFGREIRATLRNPQRLTSILVVPLLGVLFAGNAHGSALRAAAFTFGLIASAMGTASMLLFAWDGPGVRSYFLLPIRPRDVVLAKNLELLLRFAAQSLLALATLALLVRGLWTPATFAIGAGATGVVLCSLAAGTSWSMRRPVRARRRGLTQRGSGGWAGTVVSLAILAVAAAFGGAIWAARRLAGPAWADTASTLASLLVLAGSAAVWWRSLELNGRALPGNREKLIQVLARTGAD